MLAKCRTCNSLDQKDVNGVLYDYCTSDFCTTNCQPCVGDKWLTEPLAEVCPSMTAYQEADLHDIQQSAIDALNAKYRAGQKEHGGNGWEMGSTKLIANAYDEAIDLIVYLPWLRDNIAIIRECLDNALERLGSHDRLTAIENVECAIRLIDGVPGRR